MPSDEKLLRRRDNENLMRWYEERGSSEFPGVFVFAPLKNPPVACWRDGRPGKLTGRRNMLTGNPEALCASCWPRTVG